METDFLASTKHFLYIFSDTPFTESVIPTSENEFLNESFVPAIGERFSIWWKPSNLLERFFLLTETVPDMSENQFLNTELIIAGENEFSRYGKPISSFVSAWNYNRNRNNR